MLDLRFRVNIFSASVYKYKISSFFFPFLYIPFSISFFFFLSIGLYIFSLFFCVCKLWKPWMLWRRPPYSVAVADAGNFVQRYMCLKKPKINARVKTANSNDSQNRFVDRAGDSYFAWHQNKVSFIISRSLFPISLRLKFFFHLPMSWRYA